SRLYLVALLARDSCSVTSRWPVQPVHRSQTSDADPERTNKMKKTFVDVMLELPVDATLRDFLTSHGLPVPDGFAWDDTPETSQFLVEAVKVWPDTAARDQMTANLI